MSFIHYLEKITGVSIYALISFGLFGSVFLIMLFWAIKADKKMIEEMRELLEQSTLQRHWSHNWPKWEMRDVEHTLCEFDKYERVRTGEGRPRGVYR